MSWTVSNTGDETPERIFVAVQVLNRNNQVQKEDATAIDRLAPGASYSYVWTGFWPSNPGDYRVRLVADPAEPIANSTGHGQGDERVLPFTIPEPGLDASPQAPQGAEPGYYIAFASDPILAPHPPALDDPSLVLQWTVINRGSQTPERIFIASQLLNPYNRSIEESAWPIERLAPGVRYSYTMSVSLPSQPGSYKLRLVADPAERIADVSGAGQGDTRELSFIVPAANGPAAQ